MIVLRCFRLDRVNFAIKNYIEQFMKKDFIENRPTNVRQFLLEECTKKEEPIIFVLTPGVDPTEELKRIAEEKTGKGLEAISMGRGQSKRAKQSLADAAESGSWVFLANCHLSISLLPELETTIDSVLKEQVNENFRLILSANSHPDFSISLL